MNAFGRDQVRTSNLLLIIENNLLEPPEGIEPTSTVYKTAALPLSYGGKIYFSFFFSFS